MESRYIKIGTTGTNVQLRVIPGHFATNHSHINYYLDMTTLKTRISEAQEAAKALAHLYLYHKPVDTIVCMEGTDVIGAFLAEELTRSGFLSTNRHKTIYVVHPEFNTNSQLIFRDNLVPMIRNKNILALFSSVTTGKSVNKVIETIDYYGGILQEVSAVFSDVDEVNGTPIRCVFGKKDLPNYHTYDYRDCELCKKKEKLDALVNAFGYSAL